MAFLLRTVSHSAEGREIVRTRRVEGDRLTDRPRSPMRRPSDRPRRRASPRRGREERRPARGRRRAGPVGRAQRAQGVGSGAIELATGGDILIGSHAASLHAGCRPDRTRSRSRSSAPTEGEVKLDKSAERLFTLAPVLPGQARSWPGCSPCSCSAVGLAWPIKAYYDRQQRAETFARFHADEIWSSGSLSQRPCRAQGQLHRLPRQAVRGGARYRLQDLPHPGPRPCRPVPAGPRPAGSRPLAPGRARLQGDVRHPAGPLRRMPYRA